MTTLAGSGVIGSLNGVGKSASFNTPDGIAADTDGNAFITEWSGNRIRKLVIATGVVTVIAGSGSASFSDGVGTMAFFNNPAGIAVDLSGNLFIADCNNHRIRQVVASTRVTTTLVGDGAAGFFDGVGSNARFNQPLGITVDASGNLFVTDYGNFRVRKIAISTAVVSTVAGSGADLFQDGLGVSAAFGRLQGIVADSLGNVFVSDYGNNRIRIVNIATGLVSTLAGSSPAGYLDGTGTFSLLGGPTLLTVDRSGTSLFVAEQDNSRIRQIVIFTRSVTSVAGNGSLAFADGVGSSASFKKCFGVAVDMSGNLLVTDYHNSLIRLLQAFSACQLGQFCPPGSAEASPCPIGTFCASTGMSAPTACTPGSFCNSTGLSAAVPCTQGSYCPIGSNASNACPAGLVCANTFSIVSCQPGHYCAGGSFNVLGAVLGQSAFCLPAQFCFSTFANVCD